ncbi:PHA/PHB synthase family protein [Halovibrio sp. HP20-50]|uniref:PHA/PHB synthase family protein n=1 Tax=Halovibrio sp. HP20-59 TaxID=3080275 RepID=UPI00294AD86A|nr:alpha/beta fold hydrolase [Halovibrio sp. HP20-59]MEA2119445.1 alpha/beta fold hydrolase [Halovibrio sp. HP20-59]
MAQNPINTTEQSKRALNQNGRETAGAKKSQTAKQTQDKQAAETQASEAHLAQPKAPRSDSIDDSEREERCGLSAEPPEFHLAYRFADPEEQYGIQAVDATVKAALAQATGGVTPFGLSSKFFTWWMHSAGSPGKNIQLADHAVRSWGRFFGFAAYASKSSTAEPCIQPMEHDHRFDDEAWNRWPYNMLKQSFLLTQEWWYRATNDVDGLERSNEQIVSFVTRQLLDIVSPTNFLWTNPKVLERTREEYGSNLIRGAKHFVEDWERLTTGRPPVGAEDFVPGRDVATAEGRVVHRTHLMELIQYSPTTDKVASEPLLVVPAWIMKYYILDLSPHNSLIRYLVDQGYTVFAMSWRNPTAGDRDQGMEDYAAAVGEAFDAVQAIVPERKVHGVGYCLGGTLLAAKAAQMARDGEDRLESLTLFATQTDFSEPGELGLFTSESEVSYLEHMMWDRGYLDSHQMAGAFQLLRSNDLIWSRCIQEYLLGDRGEMFDLLAWNSDTTRMPFRMHSEYLRKLFLENQLSNGKFELGGEPVAVSNIKAPIFCVSTTHDHIAPWQSVYKLHLLADSDVTFVLTNGGHNAGIVSEPGHKKRRYQIRCTRQEEPYLKPETWREQAEHHDGSWWPALSNWLREHSSAQVEPPEMGAQDYTPLEKAPGTYVFQR